MPELLAPSGCANCGAPRRGRYCSACGEEAAGTRTVREFIRTSLVDEVIQFDSRFWQTLKRLVFKPGALTVEFIAGRRRAYVGPVKILLTSIVAFTLATRGGFVAVLMIGYVSLSIAPTAPPRGATIRETVQFIDRFGVLDRALTAKTGPGDGPTGAAQERFQDRIATFVRPLAFGNVFFLSSGLWLLLRRKTPFYFDHLVFSAHVVAFVLLSSLPLAAVLAFEESAPALATACVLAVFAWQFGYLTTAIRRMYFDDPAAARHQRAKAAAVAMLLYVLNGLFVTVVQMVAGAFAIQRL